MNKRNTAPTWQKGDPVKSDYPQTWMELEELFEQ